MTGALTLFLGLGLAVSGREVRVLEDAEVKQCREWIQSHSQRPPNRTALTKTVSPRTICFDGEIYSWTIREAAAWANRAGGDRAAHPGLVVRSPGGDASAAIALVEKLQRQGAQVIVVDYCMSSCANYFFAGLRRRYVVPGAMILFHGGYSAEERSDYAESLSQVLHDPELASHISDFPKWRDEQLKLR